MSPAMYVVAFTLGILVALTLLPGSRSANECSFVRSHKNEECVYNIHLTQDSACSGSRRGRRHFRSYKDTQSDDYGEKIHTMEQNFSFMKDEHEKRLKDLEGTVRDLIGLDSTSLTGLVKSSASRVSEEGRFQPTLDHSTLSRLHEEFGKLRKALKEKTEQLFDMHLKVNETDRMFEKSQVDLFSVNQDLLNAENKIAILERERAVLKNQLKDRSYKMDVSVGRLSECEVKLTEQQDQLLTLIRSENTLSEGLMTCELTLNKTREELKTVNRRHKDLKSRHARVKQVLGIRETELISCYAAKTETFCGFEDPHLCGFEQTNDTSDFFDWDWGEGTTPSRRTGPSQDHTCRSKQGHFMYIEASAKPRGKNAIIYSPLYRGLKQQCLEFYYHMNGRHIGTLNVYAKARGASELASVWRAWGNQGDLWSVARLSIPKELARAGYQIAFEGITENGYQGDIAIDDVSVRDGQCDTGEGIQAVVVQFNSTAIIKDGKKFARSIKRKIRLSKVAGKRRRRPSN